MARALTLISKVIHLKYCRDGTHTQHAVHIWHWHMRVHWRQLACALRHCLNCNRIEFALEHLRSGNCVPCPPFELHAKQFRQLSSSLELLVLPRPKNVFVKKMRKRERKATHSARVHFTALNGPPHAGVRSHRTYTRHGLKAQLINLIARTCTSPSRGSCALLLASLTLLPNLLNYICALH